MLQHVQPITAKQTKLCLCNPIFISPKYAQLVHFLR